MATDNDEARGLLVGSSRPASRWTRLLQPLPHRAGAAVAPLILGGAILGAVWTVHLSNREPPRAAVLVGHDLPGASALYDEERIADACGNSGMLKDFSSKMTMQSAGWWFNWTDDYTFKPLMYKDFVPPDSYWGFMMDGTGSISLRVRGEGVLTLDFGNLLGMPNSGVSVYLNVEKIATAGPAVISQTVTVPYHNSDMLLIAEDGPTGQGIIVINQITFKCDTTTAAPLLEEPHRSADEERLHTAQAKFKAEHKDVQAAASLAKKKEAELAAAMRMKKASLAILEKDKEKEKLLEHEQAIADRAADTGDDVENQRLVAALLDVLASSGKDATHQNGTGTLADELEKARGATDDTATAEEIALRNWIQAQREQLRQNESWAKHELEIASEQQARTQEELKQAEEDEDRQQRESASAAKRMRAAMLMKEEKKRERERLEHLSDEEAHDLSTASTFTTTNLHAGYSLFCFTLMLPFGYEPDLLEKQHEHKVGFYDCDDFQVFSNSSVYLDGPRRGLPLPLQPKVIEFSLAVEYGGKWHTALNTPVFNRIWKEVRDMRTYLRYDWVVKADIDTVWFPDRLRAVVQRGIPAEVMQTAAAAAGRRLQMGGASEDCRQCGLPGRTMDMCEDHVRWLQRNKRMTCQEALEVTARPPPIDCGCKCTKVEACDLSAEPDAWLDGHFMRGDYMSHTPAVYINNCRFGLHGPIEVLSSGAVTAYVDGMPSCMFLLDQPWGEDKYMDRCLMALGITRMNVFSLLSEVACGEEPAPCKGTDVAFHPFKKWEDFQACHDSAKTEGHGPFTNDGQEDSIKPDAGFI